MINKSLAIILVAVAVETHLKTRLSRIRPRIALCLPWPNTSEAASQKGMWWASSSSSSCLISVGVEICPALKRGGEEGGNIRNIAIG